MKQSLLTLSAAFAIAGVSQAFLIENFDSYTNNTNMNGLGTWTVSNGLSGANPIAIATDSTFEGSLGAALIGGLTPDFPVSTVLSSAANVPMFTVGSDASFSLDFGFLDSTDSNRDDYRISLTSTGGNLLTIDLTPAASVNTYNISFSNGYGLNLPNWGTLDALDTFGAPYSSIQFLTSRDGGGSMFYSLKTFSTTISSGALVGTNLTDNMTNVAISVDTAGASGDGFLVIDNVNVIPEPTSAMLGLLGASFLFLRRRRA